MMRNDDFNKSDVFDKNYDENILLTFERIPNIKKITYKQPER